MYFNDRQQINRVIHPFSTDRQALKDSLDAFTLSPAMYGLSDVFDALVDGINLLKAEDPDGTLPFDQANVRSIVFVTDGRDNASQAKIADVKDAAKNARVRLYPVTYNPSYTVNTADMAVLANDSGGHVFGAGNPKNLSKLLGNAKGLALADSASPSPNTHYFMVRNVADTALNWQIQVGDGAAWIKDVSPTSGSTPAGGGTAVLITVDPTVLGANLTGIGTLALTSDNGSGEVVVRMDVGADPSTAQNLSLELRDEPGRIWADLQNQVVLTYLEQSQRSGTYNIRVDYHQPSGTSISGTFTRDGVFLPGDVRTGQVSLYTTGLQTDPTATDPQQMVRADAFLRADYVPRNVNKFNVRFYLTVPDDVPAGAADALAQAQMKVELAPNGLLVSDDPFTPAWRLQNQGDGVYYLLTSQDNPLPYGSFGNLLHLSFSNLKPFTDLFAGLTRQPEFYVNMRVDNQIYYSPASTGHPSDTKYFLYPGGPTFPNRKLSVTVGSDLASPARSVDLLQNTGIDPEAANVWDQDRDGLPDFLDPFPFDKALPGPIVVLNPVQISAGVDLIDLLIRNNRLDTFSWQWLAGTVPVWVTDITYGAANSVTPLSPLAPGQTETAHLSINRAGLLPGFFTANLVLDTSKFAQEQIPLTLVVPSP
jgi:hypothetical protein